MLMYSCYKSVTEIIGELPALSTYLLDAGNYYAHSPKSEGVSLETIEEHVNLVNWHLKK